VEFKNTEKSRPELQLLLVGRKTGRSVVAVERHVTEYHAEGKDKSYLEGSRD
jgi:hypothetical protein